tara:strand:- start:121 stop:681 length:561 start_codon:yes stop_codon:yes gene_type:complete
MIYKFFIPEDLNEKLLLWVQDKSKSNTKMLAGNIRQEYSLNKYIPLLEPFILSELSKFEPLINSLKKENLTLSELWVNYQKKHEFNPMHTHDGIFSFIIFLKIPFLIEEELLKGPGHTANRNKTAGLSFFYLNSNQRGSIDETTLFVDKKWEKSGLMFKADLNHCVYPFYSDGERITLSGNIWFSL